ncbi:MAG: PKD domain-containing protein [Flavobacteriales bacterium]
MLFFLFTEKTNAQCSADAGPNVTICAGESVTLGGSPTAVNAGGGVNYQWDANVGADPVPDDVANPTVSPTTTTTYTVELSGGGCGGEDDQIVVTVLPSPNANCTVAPAGTQCANLPYTFTNTTTACPSCDYEWNFGDGTPVVTTTNATHTFSTAVGTGTQTFTVTLTVEAANGCTDTHTVNVTVNRIPDIELSDPITSFTQCSGDPTFPITVFDESTPATNSSYTIVWGDATPNWTGATSPEGVTHTYATSGVFNLVYTIVGTNGCSVSETYYVSNITNPSIGAANPGGTQGCGPLDICFPLNNYLANHSSTTYLVDFGDGSPTLLLNHPPPTEICHTYTGSSCATNPTGYTFSITATNNCDQSVATIFPVKVYNTPTAGFIASPVPACVNTAVTFTNTSIPGYNSSCLQTGTYTWNFGDGSPNVVVTSLASQSHVYTATGTYTVTLTATNACGNSVVTQDVCIEAAPVPIMTVLPTSGCVPLNITTDNTSTSLNTCSVASTWLVDYAELPCLPDGGAYIYTGGTSASSLEPTMTLQSVGTYTIRLRMQNSCGIFEDAETVTVNAPPVVDVTTPLSGVCVGSTGTSSAVVNNCNLAVTYLWTFQNGMPATANTLVPPAVTYNTVGNQNVTLAVTNACGTTSDVAAISVLAAPNVLVTASEVDNGICNGQSATLTATGAGTYTWSPGTYLSNYSPTGNTVTTNPTGTVTYTITGTSGSCTDTGTITLTIDPLPTVTPAAAYSMCAGETELLGVTVVGGTGPYSNYTWTPNATLVGANTATPTSNAAVTTNYNVQVTDSEGCVGTGTVPLTVNPLPPTNAGPDIILCNQPVATQLTGFSPTVGGTGPGGSGTWSGPNVTTGGSFTPGGVGPVVLTYCFTYASTGCMACDPLTITVNNPIAANAGPDTTICLNAGTLDLEPGVFPNIGVWSGSPLVSSGGIFTPTTVGTYTLTKAVGNGSCLQTDQMQVEVMPLPILNAGLDVTICAGDDVDLAAICTNCPNGPINFCNWIPAGIPVLSCAPNSGPLFAQTVFTVTGVDAEGCAGSDNVTVFVNPLPNTNAGPDMSVCNQPLPTVLIGSPAGGTWSGTGVTPGGSYTPTGVGAFTLTYCYTNPATGCTRCDDMVMTVVNATIANAGADVNVCANAPAFNMAPVSPGGTWSAVTPGAPITPGGVFTPGATGNYTLLYTLGAGTCQTTDQAVVNVNPLPVVNAGPDVTICLEESTQLNATVNNGTPAYQFSWNFPAMLNQSNIEDPIATPPVNTNFTLTVTDANLCQGSDAVTVFVNGLPVVEAGNNITVCDQQIVEVLTGFSPLTGPGGTGSWSGTGITDPAGEFTPPAVGTYWIYYNFTAGGNACENMDSLQVTVIPTIYANAGPDVTLCLNEGQYTLTGFSPATATWSGPGVIDVTNGIIQTEDAGVGTWTLTLDNGQGTCHTNDDIELEILALPNVSAGPGAIVCGNANLFNMPGDVPANGGTWEGTGITNAALGTFDPAIGPGIYAVCYWYEDPNTGCRDTACAMVNVAAVPVANFTLAPLGCTNSNMSYDNTSTGGSIYEWNYGNGTTLNGFEPGYTFPDEGIFDVTLIVENIAGCADTAMNSTEIIDPPNALLVLDPAQGCAPLNVSFANQTTGQYLTYDWDLAISTSTAQVPASLTYLQGDSIMEYPITLTATNFCGSDTDTDEVVVLPQPVAGFGTNLNEFCSPFMVEFNDISTGLPDDYFWDFGDGTTGSMPEPGSHIYYTDTVPADYTIMLVLSNQCGIDTAYHTITVLPNTVTAFFNTSDLEGCEPLDVTFTDYSDGGNQVSYYLGDGNYTANDNPTHTYNVGEYTIMQFVDNGCSYDTAQVTITVYESPDIDFETNVVNICTFNEVQFTSDPGNSVEVFWDFGDGYTSELFYPTHTYEVGGNYVITMTGVSDNLCTTTITQPFTVYEGPDASFTVPDNLGCSPFNICFSNSSNGGNFYSWDFGDGNTDNDEDGCNTYLNVGAVAELYTVTLTAQNWQLCTDTFQMDVIVAPQPVCAFTLSSFESCYFPQTVQATNFSQYANGYDWYVNGSLYSDETNVELIMDAVGDYEVELIATNQFGCTATSTADYTIHPLPEAVLGAEPLQGCEDLYVQFDNTSDGAQTYLWTFGDGATSTASSPDHTYTQPGIYDVSLVATTDQGCSDTLEYNNYVQVWNLPIADFWFDPEETDIHTPEIYFHDDSYDAHVWEWHFGDGDFNTLPNVKHVYHEAGLWPVTLTVWNEHDCEDTHHDVVVISDILDVYVPNTFTPDGDGINEVFLPSIKGLGFVERYTFQIFNRWGVVIFETNDPEMAWTGDVRDGAYYAQDLSYNWQIKLLLHGSDKERVLQGHVNVIR